MGAQGVAMGGTAAAKVGLGALMAGINKFGRTFGNSIQARAYDGLAKALQNSDDFARYAAEHPGVFQVAANRAVNATREGDQMAPGQDPVLDNQQLMQYFKKNPSVVQELQNSDLRDKIMKKLGREPAAETPMQRRLKGN